MKKRVFLGPHVCYVKSESDQARRTIGCSNVSGVELFWLCSTTFAFESSDKSLLLSQGYIALGPIQPLEIRIELTLAKADCNSNNQCINIQVLLCWINEKMPK